MDVHASAERCAHPRMSEPLPALLRVGPVDEVAALESIGCRGFRVRLCLRPQPGERVFALVRLAAPGGDPARGPLVAVRGHVLRVEPELDGTYGVVVEITRYRFLYNLLEERGAASPS